MNDITTREKINLFSIKLMKNNKFVVSYKKKFLKTLYKSSKFFKYYLKI